MKGLLGILVLLAFNSTVLGELRIVATIPNLGMLAREIGGDAVSVRVLAPPNRDAHYLEARPSMMAALRRADLLVAVGADLEVGWLPAALRGSNNPRVQTGQPGYVEVTALVDLINVGAPADRARGDVHTAGNPHIYMDPERMAVAGHLLAERMAELRPGQADAFLENAQRFAEQVAERMTAWRAHSRDAPGVLAYHSDHDYLLNALNVEKVGHIEPLPGIPPTPSHLRELVHTLRNRQGVIWVMDFHPSDAGRFLARELGWAVVQSRSQVDMDGTAEDYFEMIDAWVTSLSEE